MHSWLVHLVCALLQRETPQGELRVLATPTIGQFFHEQPFAPILQQRMRGGAGQSDTEWVTRSRSVLSLPGALTHVPRRRRPNDDG